MPDSPDDTVAPCVEPGAAPEEQVLRLHAERLDVTRRTRRLGVVRASSITELLEQDVREELASERIDIVRVPIGRTVDACPPVRIEGDTTIVSVVEEVVVIERRLVLKEEVHMTKVRTSIPHQQTVTLRKQRVVIERDTGE